MNVYFINETFNITNASGMIISKTISSVALVAANSEEEACEFYDPKNDNISAELYEDLEYKGNSPVLILNL